MRRIGRAATSVVVRTLCNMTTTAALPTGTRPRRLRLLAGVIELAGGKVREFVATDRIVEAVGAELALSRDDVVNELELLDGERLLTAHRSLAGLNGVFVTPEGKSVGESFDQARRDVILRRRQLQDDYLRWLYEEIEVKGRGPTPDDFLRGGAHFHGVVYTADELMKAAAQAGGVHRRAGSMAVRSPASSAAHREGSSHRRAGTLGARPGASDTDAAFRDACARPGERLDCQLPSEPGAHGQRPRMG